MVSFFLEKRNFPQVEKLNFQTAFQSFLKFDLGVLLQLVQKFFRTRCFY